MSAVSSVTTTPPWCALPTADERSLQDAVDRHYAARRAQMDQLLMLAPSAVPTTSAKGARPHYSWNVDFLSDFYSLMYIDAPCLCQQWIRDHRTDFAYTVAKEPFAAGKVGVAYLLLPTTETESSSSSAEPRRRYRELVLKGIRDVEIKTYITLRVMQYNEETMGLVNEATRANRFPDANQPGQYVILAAGGDNFANQTNLHLILNTILGRTVPNYVYQYDAFICRVEIGAPKGTGYSIVELATEGDLADHLTRRDDQLSENEVNTMMHQILLPLRILKQPLYGFVHADMKTKNVFVSAADDAAAAAAPAARQQQQSPKDVVFKIADFDKSSICWHGIRFYNYTWDIARLFDEPPVQVARTLDGVLYYQFGTSVLDRIQLLQPYIMFNPLGFYTSYDIYTLFVSMMMEPPIYRYVRAYPQSQFAQAWRWLWDIDQVGIAPGGVDPQYARIMARVEAEHEKLRVAIAAADVEEQRRLQREMRRIVFVNHIFISEQLKLRTNVEAVYDMFGVQIPPHMIAVPPTAGFYQRGMIVSSDRHLCTRPCGRHGTGVSTWCRTNRYSQRLIPGVTAPVVHDWDYCTVPSAQ